MEDRNGWLCSRHAGYRTSAYADRGCDGLLRVIDIASGKEQSQIELGAYVGASAAVHQTRAYVGTYESQILCIDLTAKEIVWRYEHPQRKLPYFASPSVTPERVIVAGRDKMVHALDPDTGDVLWTYTSRSRFEASPVVVGDRVLQGLRVAESWH